MENYICFGSTVESDNDLRKKIDGMMFKKKRKKIDVEISFKNKYCSFDCGFFDEEYEVCNLFNEGIDIYERCDSCLELVGF